MRNTSLLGIDKSCWFSEWGAVHRKHSLIGEEFLPSRCPQCLQQEVRELLDPELEPWVGHIREQPFGFHLGLGSPGTTDISWHQPRCLPSGHLCVDRRSSCQFQECSDSQRHVCYTERFAFFPRMCDRNGGRRLRQWLIEQIDSSMYPGLIWENDEKSMFRIPWKHAGKQDYNQEVDASIFKVKLPASPRGGFWFPSGVGGI